MAHRDLRGLRFGRLLVIEYGGNSKWRVICDCGSIAIVATANLNSGNSRSCGCLHREQLSARKPGLRHGHASPKNGVTPEYRSWKAMVARCHNPHNIGYKNYGGRGIKVCDRWLDFVNFLADMGRRPQNMTLDRINSDENYEPGNCRWASDSEQNKNRKLNQSGEHGPRAKLTSAAVAEIRASKESQRVLAQRFGVTQSAISSVKRGHTWPAST